jgi:hypothetical protein
MPRRKTHYKKESENDRINALIDALYNTPANLSKINEESNKIVEIIQYKINISEINKFTRHPFKALMNSWMRTHTWYDEDGLSKFERCLQNAVKEAIRRRVIENLQFDGKRLYVSRALNEDDLNYYVRKACSELSRYNAGYFYDLYVVLKIEAESWVINNKEWVIIESDFERPFSWFSKLTMSTQYDLPCDPKHLMTIDDDPLENDFKHELDWSCSICLYGNSVNPVRVTTACNHVFHNGCLDDYKRVYLQQDANRKKICVPCPLCRAPIN